MISHLNSSIRRILKNRYTALINVIGLTAGFFVTLALINYYLQEQSYDQYHSKADRIYKAISRVQFNKGAATTFPISFGVLGDQLANNFESVSKSARTYGPYRVEAEIIDEVKRFNNIRLLRMDYAFYDLFDIPGVNSDNFNSPNSAALSRETAQKLFDGDAIGKEIKVENEVYIVSAIADIPKNTVFQFDVGLPVTSMPYYEEMRDGGLEFETYVLLQENANPLVTIPVLAEFYNNLMLSEWEDDTPSNFFLPLKDLYLNDSGVNNRLGNGDKSQLAIVLSIAIVVLCLALINYINLQIANNHMRMVEMRLRKILGANKESLIKQGVLESLMILTISLTFAIVLLDLFYRSSLSILMGDNLFSMQDWDINHWGFLFGLVILISFSTGSIPAIKLFNRVGFSQQKIGDKRLGKLTVSLVVFQFFITSTLLISILFVNKQMNFLRNSDKGYNSDQIVIINNTGDLHLAKYELIQSTLLQSTAIESVAAAQSAPGNGASGQFVHRKSQPEEGIDIAHIRTLSGYAKTLQLNFIEGSDFQIKNPGETHQFILNKTAASRLFEPGESAVGEMINMGDREGEVVGVVEDFHFLSFRHSISPLALNVEELYKLTLLVKIKSSHIQQGLEEIESILSSLDPSYVFDYQFLDDQFEQMYSSEMRIKKIISYATGIAFTISIMGLLALSLFVINTKVKEIAIRKTLGGSQRHLFIKLAGQLMSWILLGNLIALPIAWMITQKWVQEFVYQISFTHLIWMGILSALVTLTAGLSVIMHKLHKSMAMNPVEFLRDE